MGWVADWAGVFSTLLNFFVEVTDGNSLFTQKSSIIDLLRGASNPRYSNMFGYMKCLQFLR